MKTKQWFISLVLFTMTLFFCSGDFQATAGSDALVIIANKNVSKNALSKAEVRNIFLKETNRIGSTKVVPIHAKANSPLRKAFNQKILGMSVSKEATYWQQAKVQTGNLPPKEMGNTWKGVLLVPGAVGYAFASEVDDKLPVKIVLKL